MKNIVALGLIFLLISSTVDAQSIKLRIANHEYDNMRYQNAIVHYEQILERDENNEEVMNKLAECYRRVKDNNNAMRVYAMLVNTENPSPRNYWNYAQTLAANGFYKEAAESYTKYMQTVPGDPYARDFVKAYSNLQQFYADSSGYHVWYVPSVNSWEADFGPAYYKNGLMFLSNREQRQVIRTVYEADETAFLDFFFVSDTATLEEEFLKPSSRYTIDRKKDYNSDKSLFTSNDSDIPARYGKVYLFDSIRYHENKAVNVKRVEGTLQSKFHEGPATFTKGQDTIYFTRTTGYVKQSTGKTISRFALFTSHKVGNQWSEPKEVSINGKDFSTGHPALSPDQRKMYFASDRPGGKGGVDIYEVAFDHGVFAEPVNLDDVNTPNNEMFPHMDSHGDLYFASDGIPGLGGLDLFSAKISEGKVSSVTNMGSPFNTRHDDFGIIFNPNTTKGYFSSNRKRGLTDDDIYSFKKLCTNVTAHVYNTTTKASLDSAYIETEDFKGYTDRNGNISFCMRPGAHDFNASLMYYENNQVTSKEPVVQIPLNPLAFDINGKIISKEDNGPIEGVRVVLTNASDTSRRTAVTGKDGKYHFDLGPGKDYKVTISKASCGTRAIDRRTAGLTKSQTLNGDMDMLCKGDIIRIDNIYYDLNKYNIRPDAAAELDKLVVLVNQYPDMRIELRSHTDSRASGKFNMTLSTNRAQAVLDYLASQGVVPSRMRAAGYGETLPINRCTDGVKCSEEEFQLNRRTEFRVLSIQ